MTASQQAQFLADVFAVTPDEMLAYLRENDEAAFDLAPSPTNDPFYHDPSEPCPDCGGTGCRCQCGAR